MPRRPCALRAPTVFLVRINTIRTRNTVMVKSKDDSGLFLYKIGDPRGRFFVRAKGAFHDN